MDSVQVDMWGSQCLTTKMGELHREKPGQWLSLDERSFQMQKQRERFNQSSFVAWNKLRHFSSDCRHFVWDDISWVCIYTHLFTVRLTTCWYYMKATADASFWLQPLSEKAGWKCLDSHVSFCLIVSTQRVKTLPQPFASTWMYPKFQIQRYLKMISKFPLASSVCVCVCVCVCGRGGQHIAP